MAVPNCLRLLLQDMRAAASRTFCTAGSSSPMRMAMMAMTTSSSIKVKPRRGDRMALTSLEEDGRWGGAGLARTTAVRIEGWGVGVGEVLVKGWRDPREDGRSALARGPCRG